ncbi:MAG: N-acetylneuraminate synthase [Candidatus Brocadiaceae bacterium]|nr:N-acetylneuraminate synthase [Candidatus Brocadiaceae bacterium]
MKTIYINNRAIEEGSPTYVIAEIGINHNGDVELARETIDAAFENGADAVKLQTYTTEGFIHPENLIFNNVKSCELSYDEYRSLFGYVRDKNKTIFSTPESFTDINLLKELDPPAVKIASMDLNYKAFIQEIAELGKPVLLSTGMSYMHEVANAVHWIEEVGNTQIILLHCVSCYPTPPEECNLSAIRTLTSLFNYPVGFSDHTIGLEIPFAAVCIGARIIEKHFTVDKKLKGPDHAGSADPSDLLQLTRQLHTLNSAMGDGIKKPSASEKTTVLKKRRSIFAKEGLAKGKILEIGDLHFLTPSVPESQLEDLDDFLGRTLKCDLRVNSLISSRVLL